MTDNDQAREALKPIEIRREIGRNAVVVYFSRYIEDDEISQIMKRIRAPLQHEAIPEGWKLVPIEPSDAMFDAGHESLKDNHHTGRFGECGGFTYGDADQCYRAMIAAAPLPAQIKDE